MATAAKKPVGKNRQSPAKAMVASVNTKAAPAKAGGPVSVKPVVKAATRKAAAQPVAKPMAKKPASKPAAQPAAKPVAAKKSAAKAVPVKSKAVPAASAKAKPLANAVAKPAAPVKLAPKAAPTEVSKPSKPSMKPATSKTTRKSVAATVTGMPTSDAELLAMSEDDYMNEAQLAYFKNKLMRMREEILENARETGEHLKENEVFADPNDRATVEEENMLEQRVRDRERKLLKKINASLQRIEDGSYGFCLETGEPIGIPRLLARPTAELSIEAQEKHERLERLYAD